MTALTGTFWLLSHPDLIEQTLLSRHEYAALLDSYDWPPGATVAQVSLVPLTKFVTAVREAEP